MEFEPRLGSPSSAVLVTGGASGLGFASAKALAAVGRGVALWDISEAKLAAAADEIRKEFGVPVIGQRVDVRDAAALEPALAETRKALPNLGALVHAAGTVDTKSLDGVTPETWDDGINVHLRPLPLLAKAMLDDFRAHPGAAIVAFSSINATMGNAWNPIYTAAKGGVLSLVRSMADRLGTEGIRINSISPGYFPTAMSRPSIDALGEAHYARPVYLGRLGKPAELGRVVRFLLSDEASYITAAEIIVDGGTISSQRR